MDFQLYLIIATKSSDMFYEQPAAMWLLLVFIQLRHKGSYWERSSEIKLSMRQRAAWSDVI